MPQQHNQIATFVGWVAAGSLVFVAGSTFINSRSVPGFLVGLAAALLCMPPVFRRMGARNPRIQLLPGIFLTVTALCGVQMIYGHLGSEERAEQRATALKDAQARVAFEARRKDSDYFIAHKDEVLTSLREKLSAGRIREAADEGARYKIADTDLLAIKDAIEGEQIKLDLRNEASMTLERRADRYRRLAKLEPNNATVVALSTELDSRLATEKRKVEEAKKLAAEAEARQASIKRQFKWDGSNYAVEEAIKVRMQNPDSYKHVETRFVEVENGLIVTTKFRGTNGFNAVVTQIAVAAVDVNGTVLSLSIN